MIVDKQTMGLGRAMDFQSTVDGIDAMTCVVSVEKLDNGRYGDVRIVTGNRAYIEVCVFWKNW